MLTAVVVLTAALVVAAPAFAQDPPATTWQTNGKVRAITISGGVMYIGGVFTSVRPTGASAGSAATRTRQNAAAIDVVTGKLLPWNPHPNGQVFSIAISGRTAYVGGSFSKIGGADRANLARVGLGVGTAKSWNPGTNATVDVVRIGPNGNLFIGGQFTRVARQQRTRIASFKPSGRLGTWAPRLGQITGFACPPRCHPVVFSIGFSPNHDSVFFGGHFGLVNGVARNEAAKVPINSGKTTLAFNPNIYAAANCPTCTTVETSRVYNIIPTAGRVYTCGGYWKVNGTQQSYNVSAFDPEPASCRPASAARTMGTRSVARSARASCTWAATSTSPASAARRARWGTAPPATTWRPSPRRPATCSPGTRTPTRCTACW